MSKDSWITFALDDSVEDEKLKFLLDRSFHLTGGAMKKRKPLPGKSNQA